MDTTRVMRAVWLAIPSLLFGLYVGRHWPWLQAVLLPRLPDGTEAASKWLACLCILLSIGLMARGVLPPYHRGRILVVLAGILAFMVNLLYAANSGTVVLEAALVLVTGYSLLANRHLHRPVSASARRWVGGLCAVAFGTLCGLGALALWPVDEASQWPGAHWPVVGTVGAVVMTLAIILLETGVLVGGKWPYALCHGTGCLLLVASYLGQFNRAGLVLNIALAAIFYLVPALLWLARCLRRRGGRGDKTGPIFN